jgi:hypothetical protein
MSQNGLSRGLMGISELEFDFFCNLNDLHSRIMIENNAEN